MVSLVAESEMKLGQVITIPADAWVNFTSIYNLAFLT
jgi:hypothetical protein